MGLRMGPRKYQLAVAILILFAVTGGCFHQLVRHPGDLLVGPQRDGANDLTSYFIASRNYPRLCWDKFGQWPLWNPFSSAGVPFVGNPQAAIFYPPNWPCWWLDARDVLSWKLVGHHVFAGIGVYLLCRRFGFDWFSGLVGGVCFLAAPTLIAQTGEGHYAQVCSAAWMPWAFLCYERFRGGEPRAIAGLAAVLAMSFFAGHVQETYFLAVILSAWWLIDGVNMWRSGDRRSAGRWMLNWALLGVGAAALVAVDLLPIAAFSRQAIRSGGLDSSEAGAISLQWINLFQLLNPFALGGPSTYGGGDKLFWETLCSFGIVPLELAIFGVASAWRRYPVGRLAVFCLFALAFAFGSHGPVFSLFYQFVPGLSLFRVPSRILYFGSLAIAVLAAAGMNGLMESPSDTASRRARWIGRALLVSLAGGLMGVWFARGGAETQAGSLLALAVRRSFGSRTTWLWALGGLSLILAARRWPARKSLCATAILALVAIELGRTSDRMLAILPDAATRLTNPAETMVATKEPYRVLARQELLSDAVAWEHAIHRAQGYDPLPLARTVKFFSALSGKADATSELQGFGSLNLGMYDEQLLDLLNVRYAVLSHSPAGQTGLIPSAQAEVHVPRIDGRPDPAIRPYFLCKNPDPLPRAFVIGQTKIIRGLDPIQALIDLDPREEVLMESEYLPPSPRAEFVPATIVEYTPNRVVIDAELTGVGYLVLSDSWYPGWTATDNGNPTSVLPANIAFRAVPLSAGKHRVVFRFCPPGLWIGAIVSAIAWLGLIAGLAFRHPNRGQVPATQHRPECLASEQVNCRQKHQQYRKDDPAQLDLVVRIASSATT